MGPLLQLLELRRHELLAKVREKMNIESDEVVVLKIRSHTAPVEEINRTWERIVLVNLRKLLDLETFLWNLSTFGGAFSSMGDYDENFARKAGAVSRQQLIVARELGNPTMVARCFLYMALSEGQLGREEKALKTIRQVYRWAKLTSNEFLKNCAIGCYAKVKDISSFRDKYSKYCK